VRAAWLFAAASVAASVGASRALAAPHFCNFDHVVLHDDSLDLYFGPQNDWPTYFVIAGEISRRLDVHDGVVAIRRRYDSEPVFQPYFALKLGDKVVQQVIDGGCFGTVVAMPDGALGFRAVASVALPAPGIPPIHDEGFIPVEK